MRISSCANLRSIPRSSPFDNATMHVWNANSIRNKTSTILDHALSHNVDIMCIVETKLLVDDPVVILVRLPLPGMSFSITHVEVLSMEAALESLPKSL